MSKVKRVTVDKVALKNFGNRVRGLRVKQDLSVYDVTGDDMPIKTRQHWQAIENGLKNVNFTTVLKIARTLKVEPRDLF